MKPANFSAEFTLIKIFPGQMPILFTAADLAKGVRGQTFRRGSDPLFSSFFHFFPVFSPKN
jgi:hypothetical protein